MNWIIVTGDSRGLGHIISSLLLERKYNVIGLSRKETEHILKLKEKYQKNYIHINYDFADIDGIKELYLSKLKKIGPIKGLVNNAAVAYDDLLTNANINKLEQMFKINVLSPILLTKYAIRDMLLNNVKGSIVHISSVCAHTGYKGLSMYAASKGALEAFSKTVAREWGERGIRSNCIAPGFMETDMSSQLTLEQKDRIYKRTSLKRPSDPLTVAETVEFLISDRSASITGQTLLVDCGTI
jgi:3-oxoacyl-[acyl-carrier protein] reductase